MNLIQKFSILSFLWVFLFVIVSGSALNYYLKMNMVEREGGITSRFITAKVKEKMTFQDSPRSSLKFEKRVYIDMFRDIRSIPEIVGIDIYNTDKTVLWSDKEEFIGRQFLQNAELQRALKGENVISLDIDSSRVNYGKGLENLMIVYLPIYDDTDRIIGVVASYKVSPVFYKGLKKVRNSIWLLSVLGGFFFYISFFGLFNKAYRTQKKMDEGIRNLNKQLVDLNAHLENKVEERTLALKRSRDEIQAVFDAVTDIIIVRDLNYSIVMANRTAYMLVNENQNSIRNKKCYGFFMGSEQPCPLCPVMENEPYKKSTIIEIKNIHTGEIFELSTFPVFDEKGNIRAIIEYGKVVTSQKKMERQLIQMEKLSALGELVGEIAHQINNPLIGVINTAQLSLTQLKEGDPLWDDLREIEKAGIECKKIINKFLDFIKPTKFEPIFADINMLIEDSIEIAVKQSGLKNITVEKRYGHDLPSIKIDPTLIMQVFLNVINNANDAMPDGGTIIISTSCSGDRWAGIDFADTGCGIKQKDIPNIFAPFFTTKHDNGGTGLGLRVAANIVNLHQGKIYAESKVGKGTVFHIRLPIN